MRISVGSKKKKIEKKKRDFFFRFHEFFSVKIFHIIILLRINAKFHDYRSRGFGDTERLKIFKSTKNGSNFTLYYSDALLPAQ